LKARFPHSIFSGFAEVAVVAVEQMREASWLCGSIAADTDWVARERWHCFCVEDGRLLAVKMGLRPFAMLKKKPGSE
jgi:hypothetical protein